MGVLKGKGEKTLRICVFIKYILKNNICTKIDSWSNSDSATTNEINQWARFSNVMELKFTKISYFFFFIDMFLTTGCASNALGIKIMF